MTSPVQRLSDSPQYLVVVVGAAAVLLGLGLLAVRELRTGGDQRAAIAEPTSAVPVEAGADGGGGGEAGGGSDSGRATFDPDDGSGNADESGGTSAGGDKRGAGEGGTDGDADDGTTDGVSGNDGPCDARVRQRQAIRFARGAASATVENAVVLGERDLYTLDVGDEQILSLSSTAVEDNLSITVFDPSGATVAREESGFGGVVTRAGTYEICVGPSRGNATYSMTVSVVDDNTPAKTAAAWCGDAVNDRGRIRFETGASSGVVSDAAIRGERDLYRIEASGGQTMAVIMTSLEDNAVFTLRGPSGQTVEADADFYEGALPESGDYELCVGGTRGNASYTVEIIIFPK